MNKIFLAYSYRNENEEIADSIDRLIRSHGLLPVTGRVLGGAVVTPEVQQLIADSDALVALFTRDEKIENKEEWNPPDWVRDELSAARIRKQRSIALVENDVRTKGMFRDNESIPFVRPMASEPIVKLSETIGLWKSEAGRSLEIRLLPDGAARMASGETVKCQYRLIPRIGRPGDWQEGRASPRPGGVFLLVQGARLDDAIAIKILENGKAQWQSEEWPQWFHVELKSVP